MNLLDILNTNISPNFSIFHVFLFELARDTVKDHTFLCMERYKISFLKVIYF